MDNSTKKNHESELPKLGAPADRALEDAGYYRIEQFTEVTETDLLKLHGVGPKAIRILNEHLQEMGLSFRK